MSRVFSPIPEESSSTEPMGLKTLMHWMLKYVDIHLFTLLSEDLNTNWVTKGIKED